MADVGDQRCAIARKPDDLHLLTIHDPCGDAAVHEQVLDERRALGQETLDLCQRHRLHRHERSLLAVLLPDALEEGLVVAVERFCCRPGGCRFLLLSCILGPRLGFCQPGPEPHLLVDENAGAALGERGLASEKIEEAPGPAPLGQLEGFLRVLGLEGQMHRQVVHPLLVFEVPAPQPGIAQLTADLFDVAHGLPRRGERFFVSPESCQRASEAVIEVGECARLLGLGRQGDALLVDAGGFRPVLSRERQAALASEDVRLDLAEPAQPRILEGLVVRRVGLVEMPEGQLVPPNPLE